MERPPQQDVYADSARADVLPYVPTDVTSVLDVGCSSGGFGDALRGKLGPQARILGIEPVASQADIARGRGFDHVDNGYFPDDLSNADPVELITFIDVLEHLIDPWSALKACHAQLTPGGRVLAAIPSIQHADTVWQLLRGRWDYQDAGTLDRTHVRFFTRATMIELFEQTGFTVETCVGINGHEILWSTDPLVLRRTLKLGLARALGDFNYLHFLILGRSTMAN